MWRSPWCVGAFISSCIVSAAYWRRDLSLSGLFAAFLLGLFVYVAGGVVWSIVLVAFFLSASALSHVQTANKRSVMIAFAKGGQRDAAQVLANGSIALLAALFVLWSGRCGLGSNTAWLIFLASLAGATADTWATEIGTLRPGEPRLLTTLQSVPAGRSGGVTWLGSLAALGGASFITLTAWGALLLWPGPWRFSAELAIWGILAGLVGSFVDSLLGATLQAQYFCPRCAKITEARVHHCGTPTIYRSGWRWLNNDWVNFFSLCAAAVVVIFGSLLF